MQDRKPLPLCLGKFSISLISIPNLPLNRSNFPGCCLGWGEEPARGVGQLTQADRHLLLAYELL